MSSMMIFQKMRFSGRFLNANLRYKVLQSFTNASIRNTSSTKRGSVLNSKCSYCVQKRNFYRIFMRDTKDQLRIKDNVPDQYNLIYRNTMDRYILYAQIITTLSALIVTIITIIKYEIIVDPQLDSSKSKLPGREIENEMYVYISAFVAMVAILQVMISRLPIRIYNLPQQKKYIFIFYGNYPFTKKTVVCKVGDVIPLPEAGILPWKDGRYLIENEQKLILVEKYFRRPADLHIMLGVQRDPDVDEDK